jgi:sodium/potassium-transporting ATPase subunit alpha
MKTISTFIAEEATVIRNGERQTIPATDIVVGDVIQLTAVRLIIIILFAA